MVVVFRRRLGRLSAGLLVSAAIGAGGLVLPAEPANAAMITNSDSRSYTLTIEERGTKSTIEVAAGAIIEGVCLEGCLVTLGGVEDGSYRLPEGDEIVTIEQGLLFYDGAIARKSDPDQKK